MLFYSGTLFIQRDHTCTENLLSDVSRGRKRHLSSSLRAVEDFRFAARENVKVSAAATKTLVWGMEFSETMRARSMYAAEE